MEPLHARYPFFDAAREAVEASDVSLPRLVAEDAPAVERARERVERALLEGETAPDEPGHWSVDDDLLSYPIARILVSLLDDPRAVDKYAAAEAATAADRFAADFEADGGLRSTTDVSVDLDRVLREFDLDDVVVAEAVAGDSAGETGSRPPGSTAGTGGPGQAWFRVAVGRYLALSSADWGEDWRLVNRELADGEVRVSRRELDRLLQEAVRRRVAAGLPFELDEETADALAESLADELSALRELLGDREQVGRIDVVIPELFPPCIDGLLQTARGRALDPVERFSLLSFLAAIGMDADQVVAFCAGTELAEDAIRYQVARVGDERGAQYPPPSCETLSAYGICENEGDHREQADHPLALYRLRVADVPPEERDDWRERNDEGEEAGDDERAGDGERAGEEGSPAGDESVPEGPTGE